MPRRADYLCQESRDQKTKQPAFLGRVAHPASRGSFVRRGSNNPRQPASRQDGNCHFRHRRSYAGDAPPPEAGLTAQRGSRAQYSAYSKSIRF
jgi:hypothetical protein